VTSNVLVTTANWFSVVAAVHRYGSTSVSEKNGCAMTIPTRSAGCVTCRAERSAVSTLITARIIAEVAAESTPAAGREKSSSADAAKQCACDSGQDFDAQRPRTDTLRGGARLIRVFDAADWAGALCSSAERSQVPGARVIGRAILPLGGRGVGGYALRSAGSCAEQLNTGRCGYFG